MVERTNPIVHAAMRRVTRAAASGAIPQPQALVDEGNQIVVQAYDLPELEALRLWDGSRNVPLVEDIGRDDDGRRVRRTWSVSYWQGVEQVWQHVQLINAICPVCGREGHPDSCRPRRVLAATR